MATPTDQQLIQFIQQGRPEAVAQLFDRYSADLYDFLARLVGDRDQAARQLEEVFMRVPGAVAGLPLRESVRGWLYSFAREAGLNWLRQKSALDTLPPSDEPAPPGLGGDIWKAARAMPAFHRAVLIIEELHALSPTEKARALGVQRTDLPRLVDEARKSFARVFDAQARVEGRPTIAQIDPERILGLQPRSSDPESSLFAFLPVLVMPDSLQLSLRQRINQAVRGLPLRAVEPPARVVPENPPMVETPVQATRPGRETLTRDTVVTSTIPTRAPAPAGFLGIGLPASALAAGLGIVLALLICAVIYFFFITNTPSPVIDRVDPPDGASISQSQTTTIVVAFHDPKGIDALRSKLTIDRADVSASTTTNDAGMTFIAPLAAGTHNVTASIVDRSGKQTDKNWSFTIVAAPTATPTESPTATPPIPTTTSSPTETPLPSTTPTESPTPTMTVPITTPCLVGIVGVTFNDFNFNSVQDSGEPNLPGIPVTLQNSAGATLATIITDAFGNYQFVNLGQGTYIVRVGKPADFIATTPTIVTVNLFGCGPFVGLDFGMTQLPPPPTPRPTNTLIPTVPPTQTPIIIIVTSTPSNTPIPSNTPMPSNTPIPTNTVAPSSTPTATPTTFVTNVTASVTPTSSTVCPTTFNFTGNITVNQPGTVQYRWTRSDGSSGPVQSLTFLVPGTQSVTDSWTINGASPFVFSGWEQLDIVNPSPTPTPQPTLPGSPPNRANFTLNCP